VPDNNIVAELEILRKRRDTIKSAIEQAKGRAVELAHRAEESRRILSEMNVTPENAELVLQALENEIIYTKDAAERLIREVEIDIENSKQR